MVIRSREQARDIPPAGEPMMAIVFDGPTLTPSGVDAVARRGERVELSPAARARSVTATGDLRFMVPS